MYQDKMAKKTKLACPRCGGDRLVDYGETFDCVNCRLEFEKSDVLACKTQEDRKNVLSIKEKLSIANAFKPEGVSDEEYAKRMRNLFDEDDDENEDEEEDD